MATIAAIAVGSNLGDRAAHLEFAFYRLGSLLHDLQVSSVLETAAQGGSDRDPPFLNAAVVGTTGQSARDLLSALLKIEQEAGRERPFPGSPRTLDLDLILYGSQILDENGLTVPHPRFRERRFVLEPLAEIAPDLVDPVSIRTIQELLSTIVAK